MPATTEVLDDSKIVCVDLLVARSAITERLRTGLRGDGEAFFDAGANAGSYHWWTLNSWGYALPGKIDLVGSVASYPPLAEGPCNSR